MNITNKEIRWLVACAMFGTIVLGSMLVEQVFGFLSLLSPVLAPFVVGAMIAYFGDPWADKLEMHPKISRTLAVVIVFGVLTLVGAVIILLLIPTIHEQLVAIIQRLPGDIERLRTKGLPAIGLEPAHFQHYLDLGFWKDWVITRGADVASASAPVFAKVSTAVADTLSRSSAVVIGFMVNLMIIPVVAFYLLRDWDRMIAKIEEMLPPRYAAKVESLVKEVDVVLGSFVRGQFLVVVGLSFIYSVGLWIIGIEGALIIGLIAGAVSFIPYMGFIIGVLVAGISALVQFQDIFYLLYVLIVFGVAQGIEGMVLTPLLVGDKIGLHPVAVIFALLIGEHLFGVTGMILALPVAAVGMVVVRRGKKRYLNSHFYKKLQAE